jgi:hypothetical protein
VFSDLRGVAVAAQRVQVIRTKERAKGGCLPVYIYRAMTRNAERCICCASRLTELHCLGEWSLRVDMPSSSEAFLLIYKICTVYDMARALRGYSSLGYERRLIMFT